MSKAVLFELSWRKPYKITDVIMLLYILLTKFQNIRCKNFLMHIWRNCIKEVSNVLTILKEGKTKTSKIYPIEKRDDIATNVAIAGMTCSIKSDTAKNKAKV